MDLESFGPIFHFISCKGSQPFGSVANLDFTPDDLNHYFLSVVDKLTSDLPCSSLSPLSFVQWHHSFI